MALRGGAITFARKGRHLWIGATKQIVSVGEVFNGPPSNSFGCGNASACADIFFNGMRGPGKRSTLDAGGYSIRECSGKFSA